MRAGLQKISQSRGLHKEIRLQVEQHEVELPSIEGLIFINIPRCSGRAPPGSAAPQPPLWPPVLAPGGLWALCGLHTYLCIRPTAGKRYLHRYYNFTRPPAKTAPKSLHHSCRSELT